MPECGRVKFPTPALFIFKERIQNKINHCRIVKNAVNVAPETSFISHATILCPIFKQYELPGSLGAPNMYLVTLTHPLILHEPELYLPGSLVITHHRPYGQQSESRQPVQISLNTVRVTYLLSHHLIASAYSNNRLAVFPGLEYGFRNPASAQVREVGQCVFAAWKYDYIRLGNIFGSLGIIKIHFRMPFEDIEIGEIGYMLQQNYRYIYFIAYRLPVFCNERDRVFLVNINVGGHGNDS